MWFSKNIMQDYSKLQCFIYYMPCMWLCIFFKSLTKNPVKTPAYPCSIIQCLDWCWPQGSKIQCLWSTKTLWCEKCNRGVSAKKLRREKNQKSVKNSWDEAYLFLKMTYCTFCYTIQRKVIIANWLLKHRPVTFCSCFLGIKNGLWALGTWKEVHCRRSAGRCGWEMSFQVAKKKYKMSKSKNRNVKK